MKALKWLRALMEFNFFNWNSTSGEFTLVAEDKAVLPSLNVGQTLSIVGVNRTTGAVYFKHGGWND